MGFDYSIEEHVDNMMDAAELTEYFKTGKSKAYKLLTELDRFVEVLPSGKKLIHIENIKAWIEEKIGYRLTNNKGGCRMFIPNYYPDYLTVEEAAQILRVTEKKVYQMVADRTISANYIGSVIRIPANLLDFTIEQMIKGGN